MPGGLDGQSLKLIAKLRINVDAAQWCHKAIFDEIAAKAAQCEQDIAALWVRRYVPFIGAKKKKIRARLHALLDQLETLHAYSRLNVQGFSRICGKIDRKMSSGLAKLILANYVHNMGYCKVCVRARGCACTQGVAAYACVRATKHVQDAVHSSSVQFTLNR